MLQIGQDLRSFFNFLKAWSSRNWQPLLMLFGIYLPLSVFVILALQIWQLEGGLRWDIVVLKAVHATAQTDLDPFVAILTRFGTSWGVFPATGLVAVGLLYARRWRLLTYWLFTLVGGGSLNRLAKVWLHRVRPSLWEHPVLADFSFPSGHATATMLFTVALVVLTWRQRWRIWVWLGSGGFVLAIAWTRLYLGVHYPSDILAGWMSAIAWASLVGLVVKPGFRPSVNQLTNQSENQPMNQSANQLVNHQE
jgi:membrane-associated phospholipid phosphatase